MQNIIKYILMLLVTFSFIACTSDSKEAAKTEEKQPATTTEADTTKIACDGGCSMVHAKSEMTAYVDDGETKYFCSDHCKEHYLAQKKKGDDK